MVNVPIMSDTPEFSVQYYGNPFSFAENYSGFKYVTDSHNKKHSELYIS